MDGLRIKCTNTYCHTTAVHAGADMGGTNTSPIWTKVDGSQVFCGSCHGFPPVTGSSPHPKDAYQCPDCHKNLSSGFVFKDPSLHVNGKVDMTVGVDL